MDHGETPRRAALLVQVCNKAWFVILSRHSLMLLQTIWKSRVMKYPAAGLFRQPMLLTMPLAVLIFAIAFHLCEAHRSACQASTSIACHHRKTHH